MRKSPLCRSAASISAFFAVMTILFWSDLAHARTNVQQPTIAENCCGPIWPPWPLPDPPPCDGTPSDPCAK